MNPSDNDVREALHRATSHLSGRPDLLEDVRRGGRRRVRRFQVVLTAACAAIVAIPLGGVLTVPVGRDTTSAASPLFDDPTKGDLAGDDAYLRQVRAAWRRHLDRAGDTQMPGDPHVVWAGRTPAGPAAYVAYAGATRSIEGTGNNHIGWVGFVEPTADGPQVRAIESLTDDARQRSPQAVLLGAERDVLLVLDSGQPMEFSPELRYAPDGKTIRTYQPVTFEEGAAILRIPPQRTKVTVALSFTPVSDVNTVQILGAADVLFSNGGARRDVQRIRRTLPGADQAWGGDPSDPRYEGGGSAYEIAAGPEALAAWIDVAGFHDQGHSPELYVYGATADGRRLLLQSIQYDSDPVRVVALLARGNAPLHAVASAFADWKAPLPVRLRLPDDQGILVAAEGSALSYRSDAGQWQDAGRNAALLPSTATEVRVTASGGTVSTVSLT
ncbi:hypothetical protein OOJ91_23240 [Micromonospora lupini]|uniref:hypothetical protein n=1 Tax=Micromonospora lupini TaxID=285679 RepID=UPI00225668E7|nr:hypothetical protein [Micromonospora lupini]MCX5068761.1 hypothetical protein [Micromonospora lupini]